MNSQNVQLVKNTLVMYIRMFITIFIGLYASRLSLQILGVEDYGIYNVVGGVVSLFSFISNSMAISVQRYYAIELGKKNIERLCKVFSASVTIHCLIATIIILLAETIGLFFMEEKLNIPSTRDNAAFWSYQFVVLNILISILQVPFNALIVVYEKLRVFAYISITESLVKLGLLLMLMNIEADKLIWYAFFMFLTSFLSALFNYIYCRYTIREVRYEHYFQKKLYKDMFAFASWTAIGEISWTFVSQGVNIILNIFFGPIINAARGISIQVQTLIVRFVQSFQTPLNPQIMKGYAQQDFNRILFLFYNGTLCSYYLVLFIAIPVLFNMKFILDIWLGHYPLATILFSQLTIIGFMLDTLGNLVHTIIKSNGNIRNFYIIISLILFGNFPVSYFCLKMGLPAYVVLYVYCCFSIIVLIAKLMILRSVINFIISDYVKRVVIPILKVSVLYLLEALVCAYLIENKENFLYVIINIILTEIIGIVIIWFVGIEKNMRNKLYLKIMTKLKK